MAASHTISFKTDDSLPPKLFVNEGGKEVEKFKSRILIKMPVGLTEWDKATGLNPQLQVQVLALENGSMIRPFITLVTDLTEMCGKGATLIVPYPDRVCYSIEP